MLSITIKKTFWQIVLFFVLALFVLYSVNFFGANMRGEMMYSITAEALICLFYSMLSIAIIQQNKSLIAISLVCCLLSRYVAVGWAIAYGVHCLLLLNTKQMLQFFVPISVLFLIILILPFGWQASLNCYLLPSKYIQYTKQIWMHDPDLFGTLMGLAKVFGAQYAGLMHRILVIGSMVLPTAFYLMYRKKIVQQPFYWLLLLKFAYLFFLAFVDVPFLHLFFPNLFISFVIGIVVVNVSSATKENVGIVKEI
jgi:hypothetical protein